MRFRRNVETDAIMVDAAMTFENGIYMAGLQLGMDGPDEALARAEWFKRQPKPYRDRVIARVAQIQEARDA